MASRERLSEEIQRFAESNQHLIAVMDKLTDEENAPEDREFFLFRRTISSKATQRTNSKAANPINEASEVSEVPIINESIDEEVPKKKKSHMLTR